jgi:hypothetical protein
MHAAALLLRIRVVTVSTRAAVRSLKPDDPQVQAVLERGRFLLGRLEGHAIDHESEEVRLAFAQAREELDSTGGPE